MTSPDLPQQPPANSADGDAKSSGAGEAASGPQSPAPAESAPSRESAEATGADAPVKAPEPHAARSSDDDDGPQPGNEKVAPDDGSDEDDGEGPAPGNEKFPSARAQGGGGGGGPGQPGAPGTGKRKRRRRKKGGAAHAAGAPQGATQGEGGAQAPAGEGAEGGANAAAGQQEGPPAGEGAAKEGAGGKKRDKKKKDRGPRPDRERPAFNVGDVTFGKITEITDDAIFVDLSGKGIAIFDRREMDLPDEPPPGADDHREHEAEEAAADAAVEAVVGSEASAEAAPREEVAASEPPQGDASDATDSSAPAEATESTPPEAMASAPGAAPAEVEAPAPAEPASVEAAGETATAASAPLVDKDAVTEAPPEGHPAAEGAQPLWPQIILEIGQQFVGCVHNDGGRGGLIVLTRHPRRAQRAKLVVAGAFKEKGEVLGLVTGVIKGGVEVDVDGLRAFAPGSHMDLRLGADLSPIVGKRLMFQVTQYAKKGRDVVLSRRAFLETEAKAARAEALAKLEVGSIVEGTVRSVVSFGAFIDVGGVEGLVPLSEMSHNRGDGPHDVFKQGEKTPVKILRVDEKGKIWLSRRAAIPDPWGEVAKKYPVGSKHVGKVARLQPFGAFVELEPGIDGLIHTADLSIKRIEHPSEVVKEGDAIDVVVAHLDVGAHKIGLHPAPTGAAGEETPQRVQLHKAAKVAVVGHDAGGLFVRILGATGRHARGFITAAATGTPRGTDLRKSFPLNTQLDAKVIEMDPRRGEVKLSIKAMQDDTERSAYRQYREQVTRESKFGTFADLLKKKDQPQK